MHAALADGDTDTAVTLLDTHEPQPRDQGEATLRIRTLLAAGRHDAAASAAIEALDEFEEDDDFCAGVLAYVHATGGPRINDPAVGNALRVATENFVAHVPGHPAFHAVQADVEHLAELLGQQLTDRRRTLTVGRWLVRTGRLPLGMLAASVGVDYVSMSVGRADFGGHHPDPAGHAAEVEAAISALDANVLADTSTVATAVVAEIWPSIRNAFRTVAVTESALADIIRAAELQPFEPALSIFADADGRLYHRERDAPEQQEHSRLFGEVARVARLCLSLPFSSSTRLPPEWSSLRMDPWVSAIEIAHSTGRALVCDDYSTRLLAASVGVTTFSIYALIDALETTGKLGVVDAEQHRLAILGVGSVGLPVTDKRGAPAIRRRRCACSRTPRPG